MGKKRGEQKTEKPVVEGRGFQSTGKRGKREAHILCNTRFARLTFNDNLLPTTNEGALLMTESGRAECSCSIFGDGEGCVVERGGDYGQQKTE